MKLWLPYTQMKTARPPIEVVSTHGSVLELANGKSLIDGIASWWTACHGYQHPEIVAAVTEQAQTMSHVMLGGIVHHNAMRLADRLASFLPSDSNRVFLSDSGSVAVEVAMKMSVQYWANLSSTGRTSKTRFLTFRDSYHGDTSGAMSLCDPDDSMHANFRGFFVDQFPCAIPTTDDAEQQLEQFIESRVDSLAAVVIEPLIQMAAGMRFHPTAALQRIERLCKKFDLILIVDEVATGFGRTGSLFAHQQASILPDIMCVGKGLTGCSVGLAGTIASEKIYAPFHSDRGEAALMHGPTFTGNPIACAAANASLDLFETQPRLEQVANIEVQLRERLSGLIDQDSVAAVNFCGAVGAVRLQQEIDVQKAIGQFVDRGVWIRPIRDTVYLAPAFTISKSELNVLCDAVIEWVS